MLFVFDRDMQPDQQKAWAKEKLEWLRSKQRRELDYITRRSQAGRSTTTDEAYRNDQPHELDLIAMLEGLLKELQKEEPSWIQ